MGRMIRLGVFFLAPLLLAGVGCEQSPGGASSTAGEKKNPDRGPPSATYVVRGKVAQIPVPGRPQTSFQVHHEAIDDFKDHTGKVIGMNAMVMEFPLEPGVSIKDLAIGDAIELEFAVWWTDEVADWHMTRWSRLPADAAIEFRPAKPAGQ